MLRDVYWRKFPIDLLNDDKMTYIESLMPEKYKYAPYMFYITALKMADDNGIFDLEDGVIFARLMRVKDIDIVFECADLMIARKIIYRLFDDSNYCGLVDWEYPGNQKNKTLEQRRQIVAMQIEEAEKKNHSEKKFRCVGTRNDVPQSESCAGQYNDIPQATERNSAPQNSVFSCPENDKIGENVAQNRMDDKIGENVAPYRENRKDREREQKEKETEQKEQKEKREQIFCSGLSEPTQNICEKKRAAVAVEQKKEKEKKNSESLNVTENLSGKPEKKLKSYEE
ncbi:MAG: hypothetical protein J6S85_01395, partial [Methanobrevibacter sp.]|nr:hypothetical protein [Methanobrevibacter sp.]